MTYPEPPSRPYTIEEVFLLLEERLRKLDAGTLQCDPYGAERLSAAHDEVADLLEHLKSGKRQGRY